MWILKFLGKISLLRLLGKIFQSKNSQSKHYYLLKIIRVVTYFTENFKLQRMKVKNGFAELYSFAYFSFTYFFFQDLDGCLRLVFKFGSELIKKLIKIFGEIDSSNKKLGKQKRQFFKALS